MQGNNAIEVRLRRQISAGAGTVILGIGTDLLDNRRVEQELARGEWLSTDGVFTPGEISRCASAKKPCRSFAACFAAKEAALKALGIPVDNLGIFRDVEIHTGRDGTPAIVLHGRLHDRSEQLEVGHIRLSVTSSARQTGAMVILENS